MRMRLPNLRYVLVSACASAAVVLGLLFVHQVCLPILAWVYPSLETHFYDLAVWGAYRESEYASFNLTSPNANVVRWDDRCDDGLVLVTLNGDSVEIPGPFIFDAKGGLVWTADEYGVAMNLQVQEYKGEQYLTFWAGKKLGATGNGAYYMLDSSYNVAFQFAAVGEGIHGDFHEFRMSADGTALVTLYNQTTADLRGMGRPEKGWILDSVFQEINVETNELLFEWRASEHFNPSDTYYTSPFAGYSKKSPFDFFHINSVDKDSFGNYLVSGRHFHTISYINGTSGELVWTLGGHESQLEDLSGGKASSFKWQHDARWLSRDEGILSVFDNGKAGPLHVDAPYSKALVLQVDMENRTATRLREYVSLRHIRSSSQGSVQLLKDSDDIFVGWGSSAAYSQFTGKGELLCEVHLAAAASFWWERVKSYRAYKSSEWIGRPTTKPAIFVNEKQAYLSWNGATEIKSWELQGISQQDSQEDVVTSLGRIEKSGFETVLQLPRGPTNIYSYRATALDTEGNTLGVSEDVTQTPSPSHLSTWLTALFILTSLVVAGWLGMKFWFKRRSVAQFRAGGATSMPLASPSASQGGFVGGLREAGVAMDEGKKGAVAWVRDLGGRMGFVGYERDRVGYSKV